MPATTRSISPNNANTTTQSPNSPRHDLQPRHRHSLFTAIHNHLTQSIRTDILLEVQLILLSVAVGLNDAITFVELSMFVSNQTGNTLFLGIGAINLNGVRNIHLNLRHIALSLGCFLFGAVSQGQLSNRFGRRKRWWLFLSHAVQTILIYVAAALAYWDSHPENILHIDGNNQLISTTYNSMPAYPIIALLAIGSGAQIASARVLDIPEISTAMITVTYIDFLVDPKALVPTNRSTYRRVVFVLAILGGAVVGAVIVKYQTPALGFLIAAALKTVVTMGFLVSR